MSSATGAGGLVTYQQDCKMNSPGHRQGMVFVDDDRDYLDETYDSLRKFATEDSSSSASCEDSDYAEVHTSDNVSDDSSFHSEGDELAEYWDPYRK